jgi:hypothetical protein
MPECMRECACLYARTHASTEKHDIVCLPVNGRLDGAADDHVKSIRFTDYSATQTPTWPPARLHGTRWPRGLLGREGGGEGGNRRGDVAWEVAEGGGQGTRAQDSLKDIGTLCTRHTDLRRGPGEKGGRSGGAGHREHLHGAEPWSLLQGGRASRLQAPGDVTAGPVQPIGAPTWRFLPPTGGRRGTRALGARDPAVLPEKAEAGLATLMLSGAPPPLATLGTRTGDPPNQQGTRPAPPPLPPDAARLTSSSKKSK